jgi:hypothetical protein
MFFIPPQRPRDTRSNEFKGWDEFLRQSQEFNTAMEMYTAYGVPANAVEIPFRVGPYGGNREMVRVVPNRDLPPGLYQLARGVRFWVRRDEVKKMYAQAEAAQPVGGAAAPRQASSEGARTSSTYPISSGTGVTTKFGIRNYTFRPIQVFMDGSETPIEVRANYQSELEVGSSHFIRVVIGNQSFQARFTVPRVMRDIRVTTRGLEIQ